MNAFAAVSRKACLAMLLATMLSPPAGAVSSGTQGETEEGGSEVVVDQDPTIEDSAPTIETTSPAEEPAVDAVAEPVETGSDQKNRCAVELELPEEGVEAPPATKPAESPESAEPECIELIDAVPTMLSPDGPVTMTSLDGKGETEALLLERLRERRGQLELEAVDLDQRAALLEAAEQQIETRAEELAAVEARIGSLVDEQKELANGQVAELVALYQTMRPKDAAAVLQGLPDEVMLQIAAAMPARKMAAIMSEMDLATAQSLTVLMMQQPAPQP